MAQPLVPRPNPSRDAHSRLIGLLKLVLPLAALVILSTLFLVARTINPEDAIPYAKVDIAERLREPRMTMPTYATLTEDGASLTFNANEARPQSDSGSSNATTLDGLLVTPDGRRTDLVAAKAEMNELTRQIYMQGGVTVTSSLGWTVESQDMTAAMDVTDVATDTLIKATGPAGTVTGQSMHLTERAEQPGSYVLVFNGDVKLIYLPPK